MKTIRNLIDSIENQCEAIRIDIANCTTVSLAPYFENADEYLLAPDLGYDTWGNLSAQGKEAFHLFILINEVYHYKGASKDFLVNAAKYFPEDSILHLRLKLAARLIRMNHVQNQFEKLTLEFLGEANIIYLHGDSYIEAESNRQLLLNYFNTFVQRSRECLIRLGQESMIEDILPGLSATLSSNKFTMDSIVDLIAIVKGRFDRHNIKINLITPAA